MKRFVILGTLILALFAPLALTAGPAFAVDIAPPQCSDPKLNIDVCNEIKTQSGTTGSPIVRVIDIIIKVVSYVIGAAAVIGIIVSSLRMMISNGDPGGFASARSSLIYSLIGLAIAAIAQGIVIFVLNKL